MVLFERPSGDTSSSSPSFDYIRGSPWLWVTLVLWVRGTISSHTRGVAVKHGRVDGILSIAIIVHIRLIASITTLCSEGMFVGPDEVFMAGKQVDLRTIRTNTKFLGCLTGSCRTLALVM